MQDYYKIPLKKTWPEAWQRYEFDRGAEGLCIDYYILDVAQRAGKSLMFVVKRRKKGYLIDSDFAKYIVKKHSSVFTRTRDNKRVAVIPTTACKLV